MTGPTSTFITHDTQHRASLIRRPSLTASNPASPHCWLILERANSTSDMASKSSIPDSPEASIEVDENVAEIPMSMQQSVQLDQLPRDTHEALKTAGELDVAKGQSHKHLISSQDDHPCLCHRNPSSTGLRKALANTPQVTIYLNPLPGAPSLRVRRFKVSSHLRFEFITSFIRKKLPTETSDGLYCYVNSVFAPSLDESIANLYRVSHDPLAINQKLCMLIWSGSASRPAMS